ncbi:MAG: DEAD/DEAH box helicase [Aequoribacter sp.]|uniref:DEAD/DEAH box helicase n=1 Tax=Aequoribacter sp. TaxID=2847771 RepID=UPI003C3DB3E9
MKLRDYQDDAATAALRYLAKNREGERPLIVAPTGSGKSVILAEIARRARATRPDVRVLVLAHVKELVRQNANKLEAICGEPVGVLSAGLGKRETHRVVTSAGIQTACRANLPPQNIVIVDEAHMVPRDGEGMYRKLLGDLEKKNPMTRVIGLTATPFRLSTGNLTDGGRPFTSVSYNVDIVDLIERRFLCPVKTAEVGAQYDTSGVGKAAGDFKKGELADLVEASADVTRKAIQEIIDISRDRKSCLIFCTTLKQAHRVGQEMHFFGRPNQLITGHTMSGEREAIISSFRRGDTKYLINVGVLTTGFDAPICDTIAILRPTASPGLYVQILGRGMRTHPGKSECLVLDYGGNVARHGPINAIKAKPRKRKKSEGDAPTKSCPSCLFDTMPAGATVCPMCGFEMPRIEKIAKSRSSGRVIDMGDPVRVVDVDASVSAKPGKTPSVRVIWRDEEYGKAAVEWWCPEHDGYPRQKYESLWAEHRCEGNVPDTAAALAYAFREGRIGMPTQLVVDRSGDFDKIKKRIFDREP